MCWGFWDEFEPSSCQATVVGSESALLLPEEPEGASRSPLSSCRGLGSEPSEAGNPLRRAFLEAIGYRSLPGSESSGNDKRGSFGVALRACCNGLDVSQPCGWRSAKELTDPQVIGVRNDRLAPHKA